jgi:alpha-beta hydrolase superfamily lysophospholipase
MIRDFVITSEYFTSPVDYKEIFFRVAENEGEKAIIVLHGACEHSGRHMNLIKFLWERGYSVFAPDLRGHGRSEGKQVHINDFSEYLLDLQKMIEISMIENHQIHLFGHSMGGLIATRYVQEYQPNISSLILSSPLFGWKDMPKIEILAAKVISKVWPTFYFWNTVDETALSHDPEVAQKYHNDLLVCNGGTARLGAEIEKNFILLFEKAELVKVPLLLLVGGADRITDPKSSIRFFEKAGSKNKDYYIFEGMFHEIFNEIEKEKPFQKLSEWLEKF